MISEYDLYDLHMIFIAIRSYPKDPINEPVVLKIIETLNSGLGNSDPNLFRKALRSVESIDSRSIYDFVFSENIYTYYSLPFLKDEKIHKLLLSVFNEMLVVLKEGNQERIVDLADCLHNLPIILVENHYSIPRRYWKKQVRYYCKKWKNKA